MSGVQRLVRNLGRKLSEQTGIACDTEYDHYGRRWELIWTDGPTVEAMRALATKATRHLPQLDVAGLRYERRRTDRSVVAAALAHVRDEVTDLPSLRWIGDSIYSRTEYPERLPQDLLDQADFALSRSDRSWAGVEDALAYITKAGLPGLSADVWLAAGNRQDVGGEGTEPPAPPEVEVGVLSAETRTEMGRVVDRLVLELTRGEAGEQGSLLRLWAAEQARKLLVAEVDQRQRQEAAKAVAEGTSLSSLSTRLGMDRTTLRKRWHREFERDVRPLRWLYEHADQWSRAVNVAATAALEAGFRVDKDLRRVASGLVTATGNLDSRSWRRLVGTPDLARQLVEASESRLPAQAHAALVEVKELLALYDAMEAAQRPT